MIKTELSIVFITSDGKHFAYKEDAEIHESNKKKNKDRSLMTISTIIQKVLEDNNWGIYYKAKPLQNLQVQDGVPLMRVNDVDIQTISQALNKELNHMEERTVEWKDQSNVSQTDSKQEKT